MLSFKWAGLIVFFSITSSLCGQDLPAARWPQFRGPEGGGAALEEKKLPVHFGPGKNQLWKVPLPAGISSPCIWGERIFLTGVDEKANKLETLCLDRTTGAVRWRQTAPVDKVDRVYKINSPASGTPATDGKRLYVSFGSYGLLCYDLEGKELWRRPLPRPPARFGPATSPVVAGDLVLLNCQGKDLHLAAFRADTGDPVWNTEGTPFSSDYPVPLVWKNEVAEVIIPGRGGLLAYDLKDGSRRWWVPGLSPEVACSPTLGEGLLFVASHMPGGDPEMRMKLPPFEELLEHDKNKDGKIGRAEVPKGQIIFSRGGKEGVGEIQMEHMFWLFDKNGDGQVERDEWAAMFKTPFTNSLLAIRPGGLKDISGTHVVWQARRGVPEVPSPLYYKGHIYMVRNGGLLTCLDAKTGKEAYAPQRLAAGGVYYASPVAGDGKVFVVSDDGFLTVLKAGPNFEVLAEVELGETVRATPALVDGTIYLRTAAHLYAFHSQEPDPARSTRALGDFKKWSVGTPNLADLPGKDFAKIPLTRVDAATVRRDLFCLHAQQVTASHADEIKNNLLKEGKLEMPFFLKTFGKRPEKGHSLWISLHGGGGAPKAVNDGQWENQKRLYSLEEGIYVAPRAPTNTWNLWHEGHIDLLFGRLIENLIASEQIDPDRVYVMGYSAGGDGVYQLAPRLADRWAGAAMMAGHPNDASPLNLRNVAFALQVGALDGAYNRNKVGREWGDTLDRLEKEDGGGYPHFVKIHEGKGHWMDRQDVIALPWLAKFSRNAAPERVVWRLTGDHDRSYWLAVPKEDFAGGAVVIAQRKGQTIEIQKADKIKRLTILLDDRLVDLDRPVRIVFGAKVLHEALVSRTLGAMARSLIGRGDPRLMFDAEVTVHLP